MWTEEENGRGEKGSLLAAFASSLVIYVVLGLVALFAMAAVGKVVTKKDDLVVEFKAPPPPLPAAKVETIKPEPSVPKKRTPRRGPKKKAKRQHLEPPKEIPDDLVEHADTDLVEEGETGPISGSTDGEGTEDGDGVGEQAVEQVPDPLPSGGRPASIARRPSRPEYPEQAREARIEGVVVVRCVVDEHGHNRGCRAIRGHALLRDVATDYVSQFEMRPASGPQGEPVATLRLFPVRFEARKL